MWGIEICMGEMEGLLIAVCEVVRWGCGICVVVRIEVGVGLVLGDVV